MADGIIPFKNKDFTLEFNIHQKEVNNEQFCEELGKLTLNKSEKETYYDARIQQVFNLQEVVFASSI